MSTILRIALRNVMRHRRRAIITAVTMMVGIGIFIGIDSMLEGIDRLSILNMISLSDSSVRIYTTSYAADHSSLPLDHGIPDPKAVAAKLVGNPLVVGVTDRTQFLAQVSNGRDATYVVGTAIDPQTDARVFGLKGHTAGSFFGGGAGGGPFDRRIVMGKSLAERLGVKLGDSIILSAQTRYGSQNADYFRIVGLLSTGDPLIDTGAIFITYAAANDFLDLGGLVTEMDVSLKPAANLSGMERNASRVATQIGSAFPTLRPYTFQELAKGFLQILKVKRIWTYMIVFIILLIAAVGIANSVLMSVYERIREVGVLKALGLRRREVLWMFTLEGLAVGLLGSLLGAAFGLACDWFLVTVGIPIGKAGESLSASAGMAYGSTLYGAWNGGTVIFAVLFGLVIALVAAIIPARRAAKMTATAALRYV